MTSKPDQPGDTGALVRLAVAAFVASGVVYVLQDTGVGLPGGLRIEFVPLVFPALAFLALRFGLDRVSYRPERRLWRDLSFAAAAWTVADALALAGDRGGVLLPAIRQLVVGAAYVLVLLAIDRKPYLRIKKRTLTSLERLLSWPTVSFFVVALWIYLTYLPLLDGDVSREAAIFYEGVFHGVLDCLVAARLLFVAWRLRSRWRRLYLTLAWAPLAFLGAAAVRAGQELALAPAFPHLPRLIWESAFVALVLAAHFHERHTERGPEAGAPAVDAPADDAPAAKSLAANAAAADDSAFSLSARTLSLGLLFPLLHLALEQMGRLGERSLADGGWIVLTCLLVLGSLALFQYRFLVERAQHLWRDRRRFENELRTSETDLRLILADNTLNESRRVARQKFEAVFRACPSPMCINGYDDSRFMETNEAFKRVLGYRRRDVVGKTPIEIGLWTEVDERRLRRRLAVRPLVRRVRLRLRRRDGETCVVFLSTQKIEIGGRPALITILREITASWHDTERLRAQADLLDRAQTAALFVNDAGLVLYANAAAADRLGRPVAELREQPLDNILGDDVLGDESIQEVPIEADGTSKGRLLFLEDL